MGVKEAKAVAKRVTLWLRSKRIRPDELSELVDELMLEKAAKINKAGLAAQVAFILDEHTVDPRWPDADPVEGIYECINLWPDDTSL